MNDSCLISAHFQTFPQTVMFAEVGDLATQCQN